MGDAVAAGGDAEARLREAAAAATCAPDIAEAAAAAAFEPQVEAASTLAPGASEAGSGDSDDGFEFGSDAAASDSSSSWDSSDDEETGAPITVESLPAWIARHTAAARCVS